MAYYFMLEEKKGKYRELNLNNVSGFNGSKKYKKYGAYGLDEIDTFTMMFNDELELRKALVADKVLSRENADKPLAIRWVTNQKHEKIHYDFLYQQDFDYVFEPYKVIELVMERYACHDFEFIRKLATHFKNHYACGNTASEVSFYTSETARFNLGTKYLEMLDQNGDNLVKRLVKLLLFKHSTEYNGYIQYTCDVEYRNLHEMIAFINHYDRQYGLKEQKKKITLEDIFVTPENEIIQAKPKVRKKVKIKEDFNDQISIFDMFDDGF